MKITYRKDYQAPTYAVEAVELDFTLDEKQTIVKNHMCFKRIGADKTAPLRLDGKYLKLNRIALNNRELSEKEYQLDSEGLTLTNLPEEFILDIETQINPKENTRLSGLYATNIGLATQCEPEGFRTITYYPDHPDIMAPFKVTIHADRKKYPVLLSNGNKIYEDEGTVIWEDPFKKPSYLFALVAGNLAHIEDSYITSSGRHVTLKIWCEQGKQERLQWAMESLKRAMKWDEEAFGREYDLDLFNIVAISDFNAGAMENKSLNIFNDTCLLADSQTATDATFEYVEGVVGHEYFHNWSGDRVTARDWFNLSLKEGFTVFRDQSFTADMRSAVVKRMDDVALLKQYQFPEDDGPLAHPVRPESFATIENFYTTTVYDKGAELIRMQQKIVGKEGFRKGCDLYFSRHDGQAVTIDEFVKCIEDANQKDLSQFMRWYSIAGRPTVSLEEKYDYKSKTYSIKLKQEIKNCSEPFMIPLEIGLLDSSGNERHHQLLLLTQNEQTFTFSDFSEKPILSINRDFTAPVSLNINYTDKERLCLIQHDTDLFNRYEVGQEYATQCMIEMVEKKDMSVRNELLEAFGTYLKLAKADPAFVARALIFPSETYVGEKLSIFDIEGVLKARKTLRKAFAQKHQKDLEKLYDEMKTEKPYSPLFEQAGKRALKNVALSYLSLLGKGEAFIQYQTSDNLTDRIAALSALINNQLKGKEEALEDFYNKYKDDHIVINKWLALQATEENENVVDTVRRLAQSSAFILTNPNKVRALLGSFSHNLKAFHRPDGKGYALIADYVIELNALNPQIAESLVRPLTRWKFFDENRSTHMKNELTRILKTPDLSVNLQESVSKALSFS